MKILITCLDVNRRWRNIQSIKDTVSVTLPKSKVSIHGNDTLINVLIDVEQSQVSLQSLTLLCATVKSAFETHVADLLVIT